MALPKPGDIARCIRDPDAQILGGPSNVGKQCYVEAWINPDSFYTQLQTRRYGQLVKIRPLEPWFVGTELMSVGKRTWTMDKLGLVQNLLQRIDPLDEPEEIITSIDLMNKEPSNAKT